MRNTTGLAIIAIGAIPLLSLESVRAAPVTLPAIFGDHMILQRDGDAPVWGDANPGDSITVTAGSVVATTTADSAGKWKVKLKNLPVSNTPILMKIQGPENTVNFSDVLVGDVWLASGQSNMDLRFSADSLSKKEQPLATNSLIRLYYCGWQTVSRPTETIPYNPEKGVGSWQVCSPSSVGKISAVGYYFARDIAAFTKHPVALIHSAVGGSSAQSWTSLEALSAVPELSAYAQKSRKFYDTYKQAHQTGWQYESANFNGGIYPYIPFGLKGVIWYQGESNSKTPELITEYQTLLPTMIKDWRTRWGQGDFPFILVQLPRPCGSPEIAQVQTAIASMPNNGLAVTYDIGAPYSLNRKIADSASPPAYLLGQQLHPTYKQGVGMRLALAARKVAYDDNQVVYSGPTFKKVTFTGNQARVQFDNIGGGLKIGVPPADWNPNEKRVDTKELLGFEIAGADRVFQQATATIDGAAVLVSHPSVPSPTHVRYGYTDLEFGRNNLYNQENLPAVPFHSGETDHVK